jgi:hypothetical protein
MKNPECSDPLPPMMLTEDGELVQVTQSIESIELAYRARADSFFVELKRLRKVCAHAIDPGFATHPNYDHAKHLCAWHALGLMRELSDGKLTGTKDSAFRVVAGLRRSCNRHAGGFPMAASSLFLIKGRYLRQARRAPSFAPQPAP